ncbi:MAG: hypothetical protein ACR2MU_09040 [Gaiellaceae bacterium]
MTSQLRLRGLQHDPLGTLDRLAEQQGDLATFSLGRQRVHYVSSAELVEQLFVRHATQLDKWGRARRWWLRRPPTFVAGELFNTHDAQEHARARRHFTPVFRRSRAETETQIVTLVVRRLCAERAGRGGVFDLGELAQALLLAAMVQPWLGLGLDLAECEHFIALRNGSRALGSRIFSSRWLELMRAFSRPGARLDAIRLNMLMESCSRGQSPRRR